VVIPRTPPPKGLDFDRPIPILGHVALIPLAGDFDRTVVQHAAKVAVEGVQREALVQDDQDADAESVPERVLDNLLDSFLGSFGIALTSIPGGNAATSGFVSVTPSGR
jgi:hypothetical protein